jgi:GTP-binding protein YchF
MALNIGIVGLPNVGKSTVFNALSKAQNAEVANYPFCTIQPNRAIVAVPDERLEQLAQLAHVQRVIHATIQFVDIAGLVRGASRGEGLGNQFLGHIRDTVAILHVVRCFDDPNVVHVSGAVDPVEDSAIVNTELALADLQQLERKIERLESQVKGDKKAKPTLDLALALKEHLATGQPARRFPGRDNELFGELDHELRFLTGKPVIYAANIAEADLGGVNDYVRAVQEVAAAEGAEVIQLCARLEEEMVGLTDAERREYLQSAGGDETGLDQVIRRGYRLLGLISFFTKNEEEARAWTVPAGTPAPKAAGTIHTDFERGFIRAEVIPFETYARYGSDAAVRQAGLMRLEGKEYLVQDGDVIFFRFNV